MRWLIISLLCFAGCVGHAAPAASDVDPAPAPPASGQSISWDFESGTFPPECPATPVVFPQVVLLEESPHLHYGQMTATPADCGPNNFTTCPVTRAECLFNQMSVTNGQSLTFHVDLRLPTSGAAGSNAGPHKLMAWQIFANTSGGRSVWIGVSSSTLVVYRQ